MAREGSKVKRIALIAIVLTAPVVLGGCATEFNDWTSKCIAMGGQTSQTHIGFWSNRYECFVDGEIVTVPGYEGR